MARHLARVRFLLCASPDYLDAGGVPQTLQDLAEHRCLSYSGAPSRQWRFRQGDEILVAPVDPVLQVNSVDALREVTLAGAGIALLPNYSVAADLQAGRMQELLSDYTASGATSLYAIYPPNRYGSPKLSAFLRHVEAMIDTLGLSAAGPTPP